MSDVRIGVAECLVRVTVDGLPPGFVLKFTVEGEPQYSKIEPAIVREDRVVEYDFAYFTLEGDEQ